MVFGQVPRFNKNPSFRFLRPYTETKENVYMVAVFAEAYNKYGDAKEKYKKEVKHTSKAKKLHKYREVPFSILDFL